MLLAARDKLGYDIDVKERMIGGRNEKENDSTIAALYGELVFHGGGQIEDDGLYVEDVYVYSGDDFLE